MKNSEACKVNKIKRSLRKAFNLQDTKNELINSLIDNLSWMIIKMQECRDSLNSEGLTEVFENGKQGNCLIQSPYIKIYNDLAKSYNAAIKTLSSLAPVKQGSGLSEEEEAFLNFTKNKKKIGTSA